ncbi:MAG: hypothetical protein PHF31_08655 [Methylobacter sp.]|nr:hypothetical protein [Methylobacter sp.]
MKAAQQHDLSQSFRLDNIMRGLLMSGMKAIVTQHFGFEPAHVVTAAREQVAHHALRSEMGLP